MQFATKRSLARSYDALQARLAVRAVRVERREVVAGDGALVLARQSGDRAEAPRRVARRRGRDRRPVGNVGWVLVVLGLVEHLLQRLALLGRVPRVLLLRLLLALAALRPVDLDRLCERREERERERGSGERIKSCKRLFKKQGSEVRREK